MRFGNCTSAPDCFAVLKRYGYSFVEADFQKISNMTDEEFAVLRKTVQETGIPVEGMNCFASSKERILTWSDEQADRYFENGVSRAKPLGLKYVVIGSGKARSIPEDMEREVGVKRFVELLQRFGRIAERYDIDIYLEPLRQYETNLINRVTEAVELCKRVAHPRVGCVADFYHMAQESEPFSDVVDTDGYLRHIHMATAERKIPLLCHADEVAAIAAELKKLAYGGRIALEGAAEPDNNTALREFSKQFTTFTGGNIL